MTNLGGRTNTLGELSVSGSYEHSELANAS